MIRPHAVTRATDPAWDGDEEGAHDVAFSSPRRSLRGTGTALRIELPAPWPEQVERVAEVLSSFDTDDEIDSPGTGPVAFGALPFDRTRGATLVVPAVVHGTTAEGTRWVTELGGLPREPGAEVPGASTHAVATGPGGDASGAGAGGVDEPSRVTVRSVRPTDQWCAAVSAATDRIRAGELTKVVLARELELEADRPFDAAGLLARLRRLYPSALCFAVEGFVGASPELLVSRVGDIVRAQPMAGTTARTGDPEADQRRAAELLSSDKNRIEHQITIDVVHDALLPWCSYLDAEPSPSVVAAGPVQHLATVVEGRLSRPSPSVLELVATLHPTPAVGGWPRDAALQVLDELEQADRGRYAGPVGWVDARGNGAWAVGIRSVELDGPRARMFAGVGVVEDSDPAAELDETRAKAQSLLSVLVRP